MATKAPIPFETNAEIRTITGWCCKTCGRYCGSDEHGERAAKYCCCTDRKCESCDNRAHKHFTHCDECRQKRQAEAFSALPARDYDGSPVVTYGSDKYFFDEDDVICYLDELDDPESAMLVFAESQPFEWTRSLAEMFEDDLPPDDEWDTSEIDKQISEWVKRNAPTVYWPMKVRLSSESLTQLINRIEH